MLADTPRLLPLTREELRVAMHLVGKRRRCAKYSCSGQVGGTPTLIRPLSPIHDLGFCGFTLPQTTLSGLQSPPRHPEQEYFAHSGEKNDNMTLRQKSRKTLSRIIDFWPMISLFGNRVEQPAPALKLRPEETRAAHQILTHPLAD